MSTTAASTARGCALTSTERLKRERLVFAAWGALAALCLACSAAQAQQAPADALRLRVSALADAETVVRVNDEAAIVGDQVFLEKGDALDVTLDETGQRSALLTLSPVSIGLGVSRAGFSIAQAEDGQLSVRPADAPPGAWIDISSVSTPVLVLLGDARVSLASGALRIEYAADGWRAVLAAGTARVEKDGKPAVELDARGSNAALVASDGTPAAAARDEQFAAAWQAQRSGLVQRALLPDLVSVAEAIAEGDIEPPSRGSAVAAISVAPEVRISELVPRGGTAVTVTAGTSVSSAGGSIASTAESFLSSRQAALAVVGARLERTRVVFAGNTSGSRAPLAISPELGRPFTLGRGIRR